MKYLLLTVLLSCSIKGSFKIEDCIEAKIKKSFEKEFIRKGIVVAIVNKRTLYLYTDGDGFAVASQYGFYGEEIKKVNCKGIFKTVNKSYIPYIRYYTKYYQDKIKFYLNKYRE
jgi:hypothetical protein